MRVCFKNDAWVRRHLLIRDLHRDEVGCSTKFETQTRELLGHLKITFKSTKRPIAVDISWPVFLCFFFQHDTKQPLAESGG